MVEKLLRASTEAHLPILLHALCIALLFALLPSSDDPEPLMENTGEVLPPCPWNLAQRGLVAGAF